MTDLRYALRALRGAPGFAAAAILVLALGIGATAAMFSVVDGVLLRPLPFREPARLMELTAGHPREGEGYPPSHADFVDWRTSARGFDGMALARGEALLLRGTDGAKALTTAHVTDGFFPVLGARMLLGRGFAPDEEGPAARKAIVLSHGTWMRELGGDSAIIGRTLDFAEGQYTVVGVLPPEVTWPQWAQAYAPIATVPQRREALVRRDARIDNYAVARLAPGTSLAAGRASLAAAARAIAEQHPENAGWTASIRPLRDTIVGQSRQPLLVLLGAVGAVLLIACANVANLQLVRATARRQEMAVRAALGAGRWRIARQLLAESAVLAAIGAGAGLVLAGWLVALVRRVAADALPRVPEIAVDGRVAAFAVAIAALTAVIAGLVPALGASRDALAGTMREGSRGGGQGGARRPLRTALVVSEIALALVLMVGAGVLLRSFANLKAVDPGFDADAVLAVRLEPPASRYDTPEKLIALYDRLQAQLRRTPGVARVGFTNHLPFGQGFIGTPLRGPGAPTEGPGSFAVYRTPDESYFAALGQRVVRGRDFTAADMTPTSTSVIVNQTLARERWGSAEPVGQTVTYLKQAQGRPTFNTPVTATVVGVVNDVSSFSVADPASAELYIPSDADIWRWGYLVVRAEGDPAALTTAVRKVIAAEDRDVSIARMQPMSELAANGIADRRFAMGLLGAFAGVALMLAAIGVYGVMAYTVVQRRHEIGIRTALGASPHQVLRLVVGSGARIAAAGVAIGLALSWFAARTLEGMVFGVGVRDVLTFATGSAVLVVVALLASWIPARRAARLEPARVLRAD